MKYIYPRSTFERGESIVWDIMLVAAVMVAIIGYAVWYSRGVDRQTEAYCQRLGYTSCSDFAGQK